MPGAGRLTVALAGGAGTGKSTVARALADRLGGQVAGFGDFVRARAGDLGMGTGRSDLQRLGQQLVVADPSGFVRDFLVWAEAASGDTLFVDGVRHAEVDTALRTWSRAEGRTYVLILLDATDADRAARLTGGHVARLRAIDEHPVERSINRELRALADAVVDASGERGDVVERVAGALPRPADVVER